MSTFELITIAVLFFFTSVVGVVTGSNSLITVPVLFQFGIDPKVAVATNMFGLTFLNIGATIAFYREGVLNARRLSPLIAITLLASAMGAVLVGSLDSSVIPLIVTVSIVSVVVFIVARGESHRKASTGESIGRPAAVLTFVLAFILGIYGGMYSGGYVTMLTAVLAAFYGMSFFEAVAATKLINVFSSLIATLVFAWQGLIDYELGIILAGTMFAGAVIGAKTAAKLDERWLRRIFLTAVVLLAAKTAYDFVF